MPVKKILKKLAFKYHPDTNPGSEKPITYKRDKKPKQLLVKIPAGVKSGTKIRLKGMGIIDDRKSGDLYLHIKVKG